MIRGLENSAPLRPRPSSPNPTGRRATEASSPAPAQPFAGEVVLAIDQGTTGTTVLALDRFLAPVAKVTVEVKPTFPAPGHVEHDLEALWRSTVDALDQVVGRSVDPARVRALGVTNQRETVGLWERGTGRPLAPAIVWQCRRTKPRIDALAEAGAEPGIREKTGLLLDPYFSASKAEWLLDHVEGARDRAERGEVAVGTVDSFLVHRLSGGDAHVTDPSNASRTMLFNLQTGDWDPELCATFRVPRAALADIRASSEVVARTRGVPGLPDGIPIAGIAGDQQAALFGQACFDPGDAKCTYGTGAFMLVHTGTERKLATERLLTSVAWKLGPEAPLEYALEGSVFCAGAAVQWLRDVGLIDSAKAIEPLARSVPSSEGVTFVPAFTGLGAPHWRPDARATLTGLTRGTTRAHIARAALEGIALECAEVIEALERESGRLGVLKVDGGATSNDLLLEIQASVTGRPVVRPALIETTCAGAALLAGLAVGFFESKEAIRAAWRADRTFEPAEPERARALKAAWARAVDKA